MRVANCLTSAAVVDDDTIGLIWGYQNPNQFYVFTWKQAFQDNGHAAVCPSGELPAGMAIKRVDGANVDSFDIICVEDTAGSTLLMGPDQISTVGWEAGVEYTFELTHTQTTSTIDVRLGSDQSLIASATIDDATFPQGFAGPFSHSQPGVCTSNWITSCI